MRSCTWIPTVKKGNQEYSSKLFTDLSSYISDRNNVVSIYTAANSFKSFFNLTELDEYGEPKVEAVIDKFNLISSSKDSFTKYGIEKTLEIKNENGEPKYFSNYNSAYEKVLSINKNPNGYIGIIKYESGKGYYIDILYSSNENLSTVETQRIAYELNPKLKVIMNNFGFDVQRITNLEENGVFDPENAQQNADNLIDIIKLSKGINGDYVFSEEFCHFLIAGMRNNPLVERLFNNINDDAVKSILGDEYDAYKSRYYANTKDSYETNRLLKEEAIGRLLNESLKNSQAKQEFVNNSLFDRFKNSVINFFKDKDEKQIENTIKEVIDSLDEIVGNVTNLNETFFANFDKKEALKSKRLYSISSGINSEIENISKEIRKIAAQEKQLAAIKSPTENIQDRKTFIARKAKTLDEINANYEQKEHLRNCYLFLENTTNELSELMGLIDRVKQEVNKNQVNHNNTIQIGKCCYLLNNIKDFSSAYREILTAIHTIKPDVNLSQEDEEKLKSTSEKVLAVLTDLEAAYKESRVDLMRYWLETFYWKGDVKTQNEKDEDVIITLESLLREAPKDINVIDAYISEMGHCSDFLLNLVSTIHKKQMARRDLVLEEIDTKIKQIHKNIGSDTSFIYERDKNGQLTGRIKSQYDFDKFEDDYIKFKESLDENLSPEEKRNAILKWKYDNTEKVVVDKKNNRTEILPGAKYRIANWDAGMSYNQKRYYDDMIQLKAEMETLIGPSNYHVYNAPQISSDYMQKMTTSGSIKDKAKFIFSEFKHQFILESDETEFGELDENGNRKVILDLKGKPIKKIPIYFVNKLKDMNRLNTDFTKSMSAYCAMAVNYNEMSKIVNQLETFKDLILDREVAQMSGDSYLVNMIKVGNDVIEEKYKKKGSETKIGTRIEKYYDMNLYGMQKDDEGDFKIFGKPIAKKSKLFDLAKKWTGLVGLGINPFSAVSNITVGDVQMFIEAMANSVVKLFGGKKDSFSLKDFIWAHALYYKEIPKLVADSERMIKKSKIGLLIRKFDVEQSFFEDLKNDGYYSNAFKRYIGNNSISYLLMNGGEHYLHTTLMLSMLHSKKVLVNGKETSLYDAYEVKDGKLVEKGEIKELDGKKFTKDKFIDFKLRTQELSHQFNGAFSAEDLGAAQTKGIFRLLTQFRQWMPGHYGRRFASRFTNTATKEEQEGYWQTTAKVIKEVGLCLIEKKRTIPEYWSSLTNYEKTNLAKVFSEITLTFALMILLKGAFFDDDDDDEKSRMKQFVKYLCYRTYMEVVASMPIMPFQMGKNMITMLNTPMAAVTPIENFWKLLRVDNMFKEVESGTYQGMSVWHRDALKALPYYGQIRKFWDLDTEEYMFNMFKQ